MFCEYHIKQSNPLLRSDPLDYNMQFFYSLFLPQIQPLLDKRGREQFLFGAYIYSVTKYNRSSIKGDENYVLPVLDKNILLKYNRSSIKGDENQREEEELKQSVLEKKTLEVQGLTKITMTVTYEKTPENSQKLNELLTEMKKIADVKLEK